MISLSVFIDKKDIMMTRFVLVSLLAVGLLLVIVGCGNHHRHHRHGIAATGSGSVTPIHTGHSHTHDDLIDGVTVSFFDSLSEADRLRLIDQIRQEIIAWEIENGQRVIDVIIEVLVTNNITNTVEIDLTDEAIYIACQETEAGSPHGLPPGILKKLLCEWHGHDVANCRCDDDDDHHDDD